jgi:demethylmenaquinone methyltransferase/2-methoxy-6-polyprenyl-1,4-benzoquinol methylase
MGRNRKDGMINEYVGGVTPIASGERVGTVGPNDVSGKARPPRPHTSFQDPMTTAAIPAQSTTRTSKEPRRIRSMFGSIAPWYDFLNHAFSLNIDTAWRRYTVTQALRPTDLRVLDVACGTGDLAIELRRRIAADGDVVGVDFCRPMLQRAVQKNDLPFLQGDGLALPFPTGSFDLVTIGFGLRNMESLDAGLREMGRVLRPGGRIAILEFTTPTNPIIRFGYLLYFKHILPLVGDMLSRSSAYRYLSKSVLEWPSPRDLSKRIRAAGFTRVKFSMLTFGIAVLHIAERADHD